MMRMTMRKAFCAGCSGQLSFAPNTIVSAGAHNCCELCSQLCRWCRLQTQLCQSSNNWLARHSVVQLYFLNRIFTNCIFVLCSCYSGDSVANCVERNNELTDLGTWKGDGGISWENRHFWRKYFSAATMGELPNLFGSKFAITLTSSLGWHPNHPQHLRHHYQRHHCRHLRHHHILSQVSFPLTLSRPVRSA